MVTTIPRHPISLGNLRALAVYAASAQEQEAPNQDSHGPRVDRKLPGGQRPEELKSASLSLLRRFDIHEYHDFELWVPSISF